MPAKYTHAVLLMLLVLLSACGKEESKEKFERACGIDLPADPEVLKDQHVDAGKDYGIQYNVQLKPEDINNFASAIRNSGRYRTVDSGKNNIWLQKGRGYSFFLAKDGIYHTVEVDTITRIVMYNEAG